MPKVDIKTKLACFAAYSLAYAFFYIYPNFFPLSPPAHLPLLWLDRAVPFMPWTFVVYLSDWILLLGMGFIVLWGAQFMAFFRQICMALVLSGSFFLFMPTVYPRPEYPEVQNFLVALCMKIVAEGDMPTNCFPSMHVAMTGIAAWCARDLKPWARTTVWVWSILIFITTMTTKQHYFMDIVGGLFVVAVSAALDWLFFTKRIVQEFKLRVVSRNVS